MIDLDELERLLKAPGATPGPWEQDRNYVRRQWGGGLTSCDRTGDAALIVALRNAAPELIAEIRSLKETVKAAHRAGFQHDMGPCICAVCK